MSVITVPESVNCNAYVHNLCLIRLLGSLENSGAYLARILSLLLNLYLRNFFLDLGDPFVGCHRARVIIHPQRGPTRNGSYILVPHENVLNIFGARVQNLGRKQGLVSTHQVFAIRKYDVLPRPDLLAWIKTGRSIRLRNISADQPKPIKKVSALVLTRSFSKCPRARFRPLATAKPAHQ